MNLTKSTAALWLVLTTTLITGCSSMDIKDFDDASPPLRLEDYFEGRTWAWGVFEDRFGQLRRQFTVVIDGDWDGTTLTLDERFEYSDGETDRRVWSIQPNGEKGYIGRADDVIGEAQGELAGNALNWQYRMRLPVGDSTWDVRFDDWMFLQSDDVLINRAYVSRWGLNIGSVSIFFSKRGPST